MVAMLHAPYVIGSYVVTLGGIALYTVGMFARARKAAKRLPDEERPWS
ncbi:unannotated protein [freshwater metagenome]|jgi:hypothetical protein|uniref:Unannotated protein n=1 Tax=freshwater metagenome TaxID=449393 RepID=A0A6J6ZRJ5_9ZZZZ